ncbi:unnamed protein product [Soboliphyme baturini]|uniref:RPOLD domain-containing protein n=1 Tax=Soboliphyme baturini TaxID=241478 RepID=A0A183INU8_9BILA|nr:unnamed protein product [Soboliphyme baturini]
MSNKCHKKDLSGRLVLQPDSVLNTIFTEYGEDDSCPWNFDEYLENLKIQIWKMENYDLEFDLINTEAPYANALRRIMIAEVPTMAIEKVFLYQNTSIIQDEVLAHRLGLIPIKVDPRRFEYRSKSTCCRRYYTKT